MAKYTSKDYVILTNKEKITTKDLLEAEKTYNEFIKYVDTLYKERKNMKKQHWWIELQNKIAPEEAEKWLKSLENEFKIRDIQTKEREIILKNKEKERIAREKLNILKKALEIEIKEIQKGRNNELLKLQMGCMDTWRK